MNMNKDNYTITMEVLGNNLRLAALEWRAAVYEKKSIDKKEDAAIELATYALTLHGVAKRRMFWASVALGASLALFLTTMGIVAAYTLGY